ncbi:MAG: hypothetical protein QHH80_01860 [Anaerolineae bacterium]|nr:hypothetical protein [Anaerolineae bacterium]
MAALRTGGYLTVSSARWTRSVDNPVPLTTDLTPTPAYTAARRL